MDKYEQRRLRLEELIKTRCDGVSAVFARRSNKTAFVLVASASSFGCLYLGITAAIRHYRKATAPPSA